MEKSLHVKEFTADKKYLYTDASYRSSSPLEANLISFQYPSSSCDLSQLGYSIVWHDSCQVFCSLQYVSLLTLAPLHCDRAAVSRNSKGTKQDSLLVSVVCSFEIFPRHCHAFVENSTSLAIHILFFLYMHGNFEKELRMYVRLHACVRWWWRWWWCW